MAKKNFISNEDVSPPLFGNKYLDALTRTHIAIPVTIFFIYAAGLIYWTRSATDLRWLAIVLLFFSGWFVFTFVEYHVHRGLYHLSPSTKNRRDLSYKLHGIHHDYPKDKQRLAMPPIMSILIATLLLYLLEMILDKYSFAFLAGFLVGYALYLIVHYSVHIYRKPKNFLKILWTHHAIHHYKDETICFGVSNTIWDHVYGSLPKKRQEQSK